ncbi:MAG: putative Ig domain-containing protein [Trueperaceae bacterium]|nr:MAG: putative Ig domain-containing protein [Trueperaceae bacterium]
MIETKALLSRGLAPILWLLLLVSCTSEIATPGETLRIFGRSLPPAFIDEPYNTTIQVVGGLRPFTFSVESGTLPPGISLQAGTLQGIPSNLGTFTFTITVSDANLSRTFQEYSLRVSEPPPAEFSLNVPSTELQRPTTLRAVVRNARNLQALRTAIRWDTELFELTPGSIRATSEGFALFAKEEPGQLQIDLAVLGGTIDGEERVFSFELRPLEPTTLEIVSDTEFLSQGGRHGFATLREGVAPPEPSEPLEEDGPPEEEASGEDEEGEMP